LHNPWVTGGVDCVKTGGPVPAAGIPEIQVIYEVEGLKPQLVIITFVPARFFSSEMFGS